MFYKSKFNRNISLWNVSNVKFMEGMFCNSRFNKNISQWDVSNVIDMSNLFSRSKFNQDLSEWKPISLLTKNRIFKNSSLEKKNKLPYWAEVEIESIKSAINSYEMNKKLIKQLNEKNKINKKQLKL